MRTLVCCFIFLLFFTACGAQSKTEEDKWKESSLFNSGSYTMIGEEGKLGFIYNDSEVDKFYPNKTNKYMWHFWGESSDLEGKELKVVGTNNDNEQIDIFEGSILNGPINGADAHHPSQMTLPSEGIWRLDAYVGEKLFGSVYVKVNESK